MGKADTATKKYMSNKKVFADFVNMNAFNGEPVVDPDSLVEMDTTSIAIPYSIQDDKTGKPKVKEAFIQKYRDVLKFAVAKHDGKATYLIIGIENQTEIHYGMVVRNMLYDAIQFQAQMNQIIEKHHEEDGTHTSTGDFLSGFRKDDKLMPVITFVMYFGAQKWDGPRSLHEMMDTDDERILKFVPDYHINLVDPSDLDPELLSKSTTDLGTVMWILKNSGSQKQVEKYLNEHPHAIVSADALRVVNAVADININVQKNTEVVDMCKGFNELLNDREAKARADERVKSEEALLVRLVKQNQLSIEIAAGNANMSVDDFKKLMDKLV